MNKKRRKRIEDVVGRLDSCYDDILVIAEEEEESRANMPESLENTDKYVESEECSCTLEEAADGISDIVESLRELASG